MRKADDLASGACFPGDGFDRQELHARQASQIRPLVCVGNEAVIDEDGVATFTGLVLQGQGDQVAEPTPGQRVLVREESDVIASWWRRLIVSVMR